MKKIGNANLVTKETAEKLQLLKDWLPNKFDTTDFDVLERGKNQWVRLKPKASPDRAGGSTQLPFTLTARKDGELFKWQVSAIYSTVTDGTNGENIDLSAVTFDTDATIAATKSIVLKATISTTTLLASAWALAAVDDASEVEIAADAQTEVRLLIGKVIITGTDMVYTQHTFTAQRLCHGFLNGLLVRIFESAPVHPDYTPPE